MSPRVPAVAPGRPGPLMAAALVLGVGLGGFVDGIVLHQILQWHSMLSSSVPPTDLVGMKYNMLWDGVFHAFTWLVTAVGVALLYRAGTRRDAAWSPRLLIGGGLIGWGVFNVVEGVVDHLVLGIHHVHPGEDQLAWDLGFLGVSLAMIAAGALVSRGWRSTAPDRVPAYPPVRGHLLNG